MFILITVIFLGNADSQSQADNGINLILLLNYNNVHARPTPLGHMILNTVDCTRPNNGRLPHGVDVMLSDFAGGASGFPMTFTGGKYTGELSVWMVVSLSVCLSVWCSICLLISGILTVCRSPSLSSLSRCLSACGFWCGIGVTSDLQLCRCVDWDYLRTLKCFQHWIWDFVPQVKLCDKRKCYVSAM